MDLLQSCSDDNEGSKLRRPKKNPYAAIESFVFDEQYNTFHKYGYAADPSAPTGYNYALQKNDALSVFNIPQKEQKRRRLEKKRKEEEAVGGDEGGVDPDFDSAEVDNQSTDAWLLTNKKSPCRSGRKEGPQPELMEEQKKYAEEHAMKKTEEKADAVADRSTFMGRRRRIIGAGRGLSRRKMPTGRCIHAKSGQSDTYLQHQRKISAEQEEEIRRSYRGRVCLPGQFFT